MKNQILNIGTPLTRFEQKAIHGGIGGTCAIRLNGSVWTGLSLRQVNNAMDKMEIGDSLQWCCDSCGTASWIND